MRRRRSRSRARYIEQRAIGRGQLPGRYGHARACYVLHRRHAEACFEALGERGPGQPDVMGEAFDGPRRGRIRVDPMNYVRDRIVSQRLQRGNASLGDTCHKPSQCFYQVDIGNSRE